MLSVREDRAKAGIKTTNMEILADPYRLYELTRLTSDPVSVWTVDRGVFPEAVVRDKHPLPEPSGLDAGTEARHVRALAVKVLEDVASGGSMLLPQAQVVFGIRGLALQPSYSHDFNPNASAWGLVKKHLQTCAPRHAAAFRRVARAARHVVRPHHCTRWFAHAGYGDSRTFRD